MQQSLSSPSLIIILLKKSTSWVRICLSDRILKKKKKTTTPESPSATRPRIHGSLCRGKWYPAGRRDGEHLNHYLQLLEYKPLCLRGKGFPAGSRDDVPSWGTCHTLTGRKSPWKLVLKAQRNSVEEGWRKISRWSKERCKGNSVPPCFRVI